MDNIPPGLSAKEMIEWENNQLKKDHFWLWLWKWLGDKYIKDNNLLGIRAAPLILIIMIIGVIIIALKGACK